MAVLKYFKLSKSTDPLDLNTKRLTNHTSSGNAVHYEALRGQNKGYKLALA